MSPLWGLLTSAAHRVREAHRVELSLTVIVWVSVFNSVVHHRRPMRTMSVAEGEGDARLHRHFGAALIRSLHQLFNLTLMLGKIATIP